MVTRQSAHGSIFLPPASPMLTVVLAISCLLELGQSHATIAVHVIFLPPFHDIIHNIPEGGREGGRERGREEGREGGREGGNDIVSPCSQPSHL